MRFFICLHLTDDVLHAVGVNWSGMMRPYTILVSDPLNILREGDSPVLDTAG